MPGEPMLISDEESPKGSLLLPCGRRLLGSDVVGYGKRSATFGATGCKHLAAVLRGHTLAEAVLVHTTAVGGLVSSFHLYIGFIVG